MLPCFIYIYIYVCLLLLVHIYWLFKLLVVFSYLYVPCITIHRTSYLHMCVPVISGISYIEKCPNLDSKLCVLSL